VQNTLKYKGIPKNYEFFNFLIPNVEYCVDYYILVFNIKIKISIKSTTNYIIVDALIPD